ncbi:matrilin-2 [Parasteatoda tepidariorum]|uniref:matrilin-2 n=1 Tax=Parasteatoda tepidariorum TaxID=114398 RepID=UPI001C71A58C|nr:latent-transforming growth factor beta-binding protein 2 [Parasteatoda tepidariorum]
MFYNFISILIVSISVQSFVVTDATKNILKPQNNEVLFKLTNAKADETNAGAENNLNQQATACDCGENSIGCKFIEEKKICDCKEGYAQGIDGICIETCNETQTCKNGGSCLQHFCVCLPGTSGPFCESIYDCLHSDMCRKDDHTDCSYDVDRQKAYCRCSTMEYRFDAATKTCRSCLCTYWASQDLGSFSWCDYQQGRQVCVCSVGYSYNPHSESCENCYCESNSTWCGFDDDGKKLCGCKKGNYFDGYLCNKCLCGDHGICDPNVVFPSCVCDEGYAEHQGICVECSCGQYGKCSYDEHKKQIGCKCDIGYAEKMGKCEKCYCGDNVNCTFDGDRKICGCESGYEEANGFCKDLNECEKHNPCKQSMTCINLPGSYACICKEGYKTVIVDTLIKPLEICQDIDECENSSACAQPNTFCENTIGSYNCICESGFVSRGMLDSSLFCEKSTATAIYTTIAIASFVSLIITGAVVYYVKKTFREEYTSYNQELK